MANGMPIVFKEKRGMPSGLGAVMDFICFRASSTSTAVYSLVNSKFILGVTVLSIPCRMTSKSLQVCVDHYEALGFPRHKTIDAKILHQEYRKKAMLVHPDKNMGSSQASESFKKLQRAYEVLSDSIKKRDYDEQLRKEESRTRSVCQRSHSTSHQGNQDYRSEESRRIQCTKCGFHIYEYAPMGARLRQDGVRIAVSIIKPRMEMDGWNTEARWYLNVLKRWKYHVLLSVLRAKSLMYQNGLSVREWLVGPTLISPASM